MPARNELDFAELSTYSEMEIGYDRWLGYTLASQGKHGEASDCFRQILEWNKQLQLLEHPDKLHICENLVESLIPLKEYGEAEGILKQCFNIMQSKFKHLVDKRCGILDDILYVMEAQGKEEDEDEEYYDYQDQLAELVGWDTSDSDEDGAQVQAEAGNALTHTLQEVDEPPMDFWINSVWSQMDVPDYGGIFEDEPDNMELPFTSEPMESDAAKRKRRDTRDSVVTNTMLDLAGVDGRKHEQ
ncbi:hypothetical protein N0V85_003329 [Neurospora sp. IMI 360204]|nr:hypothetical protein N0V85_003329 [Neurospora sp. IMI 360204]